MKGLAKFLVEAILGEAAKIDKVVVVYSGRFQPFHKGHYATYDHLVKKFGKDNVYIGTSDVTDSNKSPFNFKEKKAIMMKMFGIPSSKIVNVRNPYAPEEILNKYDEDTTGLIVVVGEKDQNRLGGKYFTLYKGKVTEPYLDKGYVYAAPAQPNAISGTDVRYWLSAGSEADRKKNFMKAYPKFDDQVFKMITLKLKKLKECINEEIKLNVKVGDEILMGKFKNKKVVVKSIGKDEYGMPTINGKKAVTFRIPKKDIKEGLGGGAGVGLSLPGGYINGAPNPKDVKKLKSKLDKDGSEEYTKLEAITTKNHVPVKKGGADDDFNHHHKTSMYTPDYGHGAELDTIDFDDDREKKVGHQTDTKDTQNKGYEPVKEANNLKGGKADGMSLNDIAKMHGVSVQNLKQEFMKGYAIEREHTSDPNVAKEIALDHLYEHPSYYTRLAVVDENILKEYSGADSFYNDGNTVTGTQWNASWDEYDAAGYYTKDLPGWQHYHEKPSEHELKRLKNQSKLPIDNHDDSVHKYNRTLKYGYKLPSDFIKGDGKSTAGTTDVYPNQYDNQPGTDERINMDPTIDIDGETIKDEERHIAKSVKLRNPVVKEVSDTFGSAGFQVSGIFSEMEDISSEENLDPKNPDGWEQFDKKTNKFKKRIVSEGVKELEKERDKLFLKALKMMPNSPAQMKVRLELDKVLAQIKKLKKESINESLLLEGGAYGHMNHPFDIEMNLTFGDLKQIVVRALNGDLELAREKTDGQALAISWVNGRLVAARNKSHTKNQGEGAMTIGQVASQFAGRGELTNAYTFAMNDLSKAIAALTEPQRKKIFKDGKCFMNLEVIYPKNSNVIPYGQNLLVFHGTFEYNKEGEVIGENQEAAKILAGMIKQVNKHVQDTYTIQGPPMQSLPKSQALSKLQGKYIGMINKLQKEFGLSDSDGVADYHQAWWENYVEKNAKKLDINSKIGLVKRWAFGDKSFRINQIQDDKIKAWADKTEKQDQQKIMKDNLMKFEQIFLGVGADVLSFMESVLTANPSDATKQLRKELGNAIKQIKASGNPQQIEKLKIELSRLNAIGGFDKIVPNEGIVFVYGGNTYKLTGAFAPLNQILGIFKYGR